MPVLGTLDWILLAILALSVLVGLWRGLVFEVLSLLGWIAAYVGAQAFSGEVSAWLPVGAPGSGIRHAAAFALTFLAVLVVWALGARLVRLLVTASPLSGLDRLLGAVFGLLRGALVLLVIGTVVAMTPAVRAPLWQESRGAAWTLAVLHELKPWLPDTIAQHLPA